MADLVPVAASVVPGANAILNGGRPPLAGETITRGQAIYQKASDSKIYKADNNVGTPFPEAVAVGVSLSDAAAGQSVLFITEGPLVLGCAIAPGVLYCVSANAGGICPSADLGAGKATTILGWGLADAVTLQLKITATGVSQ